MDHVIYTHPDFSTFPSEEFDHNPELNLKRENRLNLKKANIDIYHADPFIKGSKLYWINISASLYPYPLVGKYLSKTNPSKDEIKQFIKAEVLDQLTPAPKVLSFDEKYKYYFRVKQEINHDLYEIPLNTPEYFTVFSNHSISDEVALLMVHAEIYRFTNANEKYYGQPNQVISFDSSSFDLEPENLSDPSKYEGLTEIKISRLKKPNPNYSFFVKFHPEAIIQSISISDFDNEQFPEIDINDDLWLQIDLIDCLSKKKLSHKEMGLHTITFQSTSIDSQKRENVSCKRTTRLTTALTRELKIENDLINQPYMKEIINKFLQEAILNLSMKNDLKKSRFAPYQAISYPFAEHYVKNKPFLGNRAISIDIL